MRLAQAAAFSPSQATDAHFDDLSEHFDEDEIIRIVGVIAISGFMNRWNATVATQLEAKPKEAAEARLGPAGWVAGIHSELSET